jgi:uncharacterized coiled-coil protein SlyX
MKEIINVLFLIYFDYIFISFFCFKYLEREIIAKDKLLIEKDQRIKELEEQKKTWDELSDQLQEQKKQKTEEENLLSSLIRKTPRQKK